MKKGLKALLLVMCAFVLVVATVFTTLAFLETRTQNILNTFSIGSVQIELKEAEVDMYGKLADENNINYVTKGQEYKIVPGQEYVKDAQLTVKAGSEKSFVYVEVKNTLPNNLLTTAPAIAEGWNVLKNGDTTVPNVWYKEVSANAVASGDLSIPVFATLRDDTKATFKVADEISGITIDKATQNIIITGYAIQQDGFDAYSGWLQVSALAEKTTENEAA